jgi:hypothetical protein
MTYNAGTATDYLDLLDQLIEIVTGRHMGTAVVNAGGTGHAIGDVITIDNTGATFTETALIEVVTVSAGVITAIRIYRGGVYTVDPTTTTGNAQSATTGAGINATFDITFAATGWTQNVRESEAVSATVGAAGTGYTNGSTDVLTLVGGVLAPGGSAATFTATVTGGTVDSVALLAAGDYEVFPTNAVLTTVAPAGGTGCTLNVTWQDVTGDTIVVLQGDAGAALDPLVGIKTYSSDTDETGANTVFNWALFGMSAWSDQFALHQQSNVSPGFNVGLGDGTLTASTTGDGAFVPLKDSDAFNIQWWCSATGRRVTMIARVEAAATVFYAQFSFGLLNQFGIATELPFPAYVAAPSDRRRVWYRDTLSIWGGISEVISRNNGPMFVWTPEGSWLEAKNASITGNQSTTVGYATENVTPRVNVWPLGPSNVHDTSDDVIWATAGSLGFDNDDFTLVSGAIAIYRTPDTGGDLFPLYPVTVVQADSATDFFRTFGEIDGVWWFHIADAAISSEDRFTQGSVAYSIFQNGTRIQDFSYLALRED